MNTLGVVLAVLGTVSAADKSCRALVMSGGANKGAYEAGVLHGLSNLLKGSDAHYDVVSGVSAGALNAAGIAMWRADQPKEMADWLLSYWRSITADQIYQSWPNGYTEGLTTESGVFDTTPLLNTLTETMAQLGGIVQRKVVVTAVDVNTGDYVTYTEANTPFEELPQRFLASASIPFVFPHQVIGNRVLMDGGTVWNTNLGGAVDRCRETVDNDSQITMDIIICSDSKLEAITASGNSINNYLRYWDVSGFHSALRDVNEFKKAFPKINYRYFFMPSKPVASGLQLLDFSPEIIEPMIQIGIDDAARVIGTTQPGEMFAKFEQWVDNQDNIRSQYPHLSDYLHNQQVNEMY